jgi:hypothetical protein
MKDIADEIGYYTVTFDFASCRCEAGEAGRGNLEHPKG